METKMVTKVCSRCRLEKPTNEFGNSKSNKDGLRSQCKDCDKIDNKKYRENNKEHCRELSFNYYHNNIDKYDGIVIDNSIIKACTKCKVDKKLSEFGKKKLSSDGVRSQCKDCDRIDKKKWYANNIERSSETSRKYRTKNKEKVSAKQKEYRDKNKEKRSLSFKIWSSKNKERLRELKNRRHKERYESDPIYRLECKIRSDIKKYLSKKGYTKSSKTHEILGCTFEEFKQHLESQFEPWMNWDNRGKYNGQFNHGWDIDHVICLSSATTEEDVIKLNHYTNLQPLCSKINRDIKKNKIDY